MADQEVNVEESGAYKSLGKFGQTISSLGWVLALIGLIWFGVVWVKGSEEAAFIGIPISLVGFLLVIGGQGISCMVAIARNTETTNNILTRQTELLETLIKKDANKDD